MCGIAGLFSKSLDVSGGLGGHLGAMLLQLSDRGPDSAGVAVLPRPGAGRLVQGLAVLADPEQDWAPCATRWPSEFGAGEPEVRASHAVIVVETDADVAQDWLREHFPSCA